LETPRNLGVSHIGPTPTCYDDFWPGPGHISTSRWSEVIFWRGVAMAYALWCPSVNFFKFQPCALVDPPEPHRPHGPSTACAGRLPTWMSVIRTVQRAFVPLLEARLDYILQPRPAQPRPISTESVCQTAGAWLLILNPARGLGSQQTGDVAVPGGSASTWGTLYGYKANHTPPRAQKL
jgi:hypothetical protein